jgi:hypothetical protein
MAPYERTSMEPKSFRNGGTHTAAQELTRTQDRLARVTAEQNASQPEYQRLQRRNALRRQVRSWGPCEDRLQEGRRREERKGASRPWGMENRPGRRNRYPTQME